MGGGPTTDAKCLAEQVFTRRLDKLATTMDVLVLKTSTHERHNCRLGVQLDVQRYSRLGMGQRRAVHR